MASGSQHWGLLVGIVVCLLIAGHRVGAVSDGKEQSDPKPPTITCNTSMWDSVSISIPSVPEPTGGTPGSMCTEPAIVEDIVKRCEKRYCCEASCNCMNSTLTEEPCMVTPPQVTPVELVCVVQHKLPPRFYKKTCCTGFEEINKICFAKINCDAAGGGCDHDCVKGNTSHVCTCGEGYQLTNRTKCVEIPETTTTSTTSTSSTTTTTPTTTTTTPTTTLTTTMTTPTTTTQTTTTSSTPSTPGKITRVPLPTTTTQSSTTTSEPEHGAGIGNKDSHGPQIWMLVLFPLLALLLILLLLFCFCCRKRKPLYVKHDDEPTLTYENETYGRTGGATGMAVLPPMKFNKGKVHPHISQVMDVKPQGKSVKIVENDLYENERPYGKEPKVTYDKFVSEVCNMGDEEDGYLVAMSVYASGLPPPYVKEEPHYEPVGQGAVGPLPMKEPLQGIRTVEIENTLNENMEDIYSEIP